MKIYVVKTMRLHNYLSQCGFIMLRPDVDRNNDNFIVFLYEDTKELRQAITNYKK